MAQNRQKRRGALGLALLVLAEAALVVAGSLAVTHPASAQVLDERFPFLEGRQRRNQQQQQYQQWNQQLWNLNQGYDQPRPGSSGESARVPVPRRPDIAPSANVLVFGDVMAEWLAYGLEEAFAETPEIGVVRRPRPNTGLIRVEIRNESYDWPQSAREILNTEKPDYIVMMIGTADRRGIREAIKAQAARTPAGQKQTGDQAKQAQTGQPAPTGQPAQPQAATTPPAAAAKKSLDTEAPQETAQDQEQPSIMAPESAIAGTVVREFRSEEWGELYGKRVDEMIGVLKTRNVPVFWVGLPSVRGSRATSEMVYLNDIYRTRAEKAGINYVDIWDGFIDESGVYNNYGPDFEGQTRRLRAADGAQFTRAGARKLAHYVEREIRRVMMARATPLATPMPQEPEPEADAKAPPAAAAPGLPPRPIASPVMSLTAPRGSGETLLGGAAVRNASSDSVATRVLVKGESIEAPAGRADDFQWPRRDVITATGVLPPDPVEPPPRAEPATAAAPTTPAGATPARQAAAPRQQRERRTETTTGWQAWGQPWGQQRQEERPRSYAPPSFFGGWFGR